MKKTITIMGAIEAVKPFLTDKSLQSDYHNDYYYRRINLDDIETVMNFLDNEAVDIKRLDEKMCEFFELDWEDGWYISTWQNEYLNEE